MYDEPLYSCIVTQQMHLIHSMHMKICMAMLWPSTQQCCVKALEVPSSARHGRALEGYKKPNTLRRRLAAFQGSSSCLLGLGKHMSLSVMLEPSSGILPSLSGHESKAAWSTVVNIALKATCSGLHTPMGVCMQLLQLLQPLELVTAYVGACSQFSAAHHPISASHLAAMCLVSTPMGIKIGPLAAGAASAPLQTLQQLQHSFLN